MAPQPALQQPMEPPTALHAPVTTSQAAPPLMDEVPQTAAHPPLISRSKAHCAPPSANGHAQHPAANGHAKQRPSRRRGELARGTESATGAALKLHTAIGHASGRGGADGDAKLPLSAGASPAAGAAVDADGLQKEARWRPGLKIMLRRSGAVESVQPAAKHVQASEAPRGRLTVKLRTSRPVQASAERSRHISVAAEHAPRFPTTST